MRVAEVQFSNRGQTVVATLSGEIDLSNAERIGAAIGVGTPNEAHILVVDLTTVDYLDSAGIRLLYQLRERLRVRGQVLRLVVPPASPSSDALRLAGVAGQVETIETLEAALDQSG
ncbi:MAG TPA: STAS domain-containing protein [Solirubrobacteraceae bacterium]|jgi:anti-anti-sigma factor|nr:STAS domain-containing protein [Solirubrobacteraceae bacterium]